MSILASALQLAGQQPGVSKASARHREKQAEAFGQASFQRLYEKEAPALLRYAVRLTGSPDFAEDAVQDCFLRFLRRKPETDSEAHRRNYLFRMMSNAVADRIRRRPPVEPMQPEVLDRLATRAPKESRGDVLQAMAELKPRDRQVLWLAHVEGFRHDEIGPILGLTAASIRVIAFRARKRLASILERKGLGPGVS